MADRGVSTGFVAGVAVAVVLGGGAVAASFLPEGSVGTAQIRDQAVTNSRIANNAVGAAKIRDGAVTTKQIKDGTIRPVDFSWMVWGAIADMPGRQGATGPAGATGAQGASGTVGPAGTCTAQTILSGSGPPSYSTGNDGDFYVDTAAEVIYGPREGGAWPTPGTSLVGPTGPQGTTGPQGATGPQGPPGASTLNGCVPPSDAIGNDGDFYIDTAASAIYGPKAAGAWPSTGTSLIGPAGATGATGPPGPQGVPGGTFTPEYGQWSSTETQGGAAFASATTVVPLTFNVQDIPPTSGISVDAAPRNWNWRFTTEGEWAGGFSAQIRKSGNGTATVGIWWQVAPPSSGCDEASDFSNTPNSATRVRLASAGDQSTMAVLFVFPVPAGGMCGRLVANSEGPGTEPQEMQVFYDPPLDGTRPSAPSIIANVWRIG